MPESTFITVLTNTCLKFTKYIVVLVLTLIMCIPVLYHLANQDLHQIQQHPLHTVFDSSHKNIKQKLHLTRTSIIYGDQKQQLQHFVNHYISQKSKEGWRVIKWQFDTQAQLNQIIPINEIKMNIQQYLDFQQQAPRLWIIYLDTHQDQISKFQQILNLSKRYINDSYVVVSDQIVKILGFTAYPVPKINPQQFYLCLSHKFNITIQQAQILTQFYGSISQTITNTQTNDLTLNDLLNNNLKGWKDQTNKQKKQLEKLCKKGVIQSKIQLPGLAILGAFYYQKHYYWRNPLSMLNYQLLTNTHKCFFKDSGLEPDQIPAEPKEEEDQDWEEGQSDYWLQDKIQDQLQGQETQKFKINENSTTIVSNIQENNQKQVKTNQKQQPKQQIKEKQKSQNKKQIKTQKITKKQKNKAKPKTKTKKSLQTVNMQQKNSEVKKNKKQQLKVQKNNQKKKGKMGKKLKNKQNQKNVQTQPNKQIKLEPIEKNKKSKKIKETKKIQISQESKIQSLKIQQQIQQVQQIQQQVQQAQQVQQVQQVQSITQNIIQSENQTQEYPILENDKIQQVKNQPVVQNNNKQSQQPLETEPTKQQQIQVITQQNSVPQQPPNDKQAPKPTQTIDSPVSQQKETKQKQVEK